MKLSEVKVGGKAVIVKVAGHGGFRKRIVEMGFIKGKMVEVINKAPLGDPIEYRIMGYNVSLRLNEAQHIEVISVEEAEEIAKQNTHDKLNIISEDEIRSVALQKRKDIQVALVGNPNAGKTSLFNVISGAKEKVGNYSGVTVDAKTNVFEYKGYHISLVDLPGTYSLSAYSPEERYVRKQIAEEHPDIIVNVVDAGNLERNLFLTTQLIDMNLRVVIALNMYDELQAKGDKFDYQSLSKMIGIPMIPTISNQNFGIDNLLDAVIRVYESCDYIDEDGNLIAQVADDNLLDKQYHTLNLPHKHTSANSIHTDIEKNKNQYELVRHIHIGYGNVIEDAIMKIKHAMQQYNIYPDDYTPRYIAIKLLEKDVDIESYIKNFDGASEILQVRDSCEKIIQSQMKDSAENLINDSKYGFIAGALKETYFPAVKKNNNSKSSKIDSVLINKYLGYPIFLLIIFITFQATFYLGSFPMEWIETGVDMFSSWLRNLIAPGIFRDLLVDGIIGGVGGVLVFLPNILILYFFLSLLESTGYMARAAFLMDKIMHFIGLHGRSFIPLVMGFGCNVPAIMATRTIENKNARMVTILISPLMSCSARMPIYLLFAGAFFANNAGTVLFLLYFIGIILAALMAKIFKKFLFSKEETPFVMELPPYRLPSAKNILKETWDRGVQYLKKIGTTILLGSIIIWALSYFPMYDGKNYEELSVMERGIQKENSYLGKMGKAIQPVFEPLGFDWRSCVALVTGVAAKEVVISTLGVLYESENDTSLSSKLVSAVNPDGTHPFNPIIAFSFMLFVLIYIPCIATIATIYDEAKSWGWTLFSTVYSLMLAWIVSFIFYQSAIHNIWQELLVALVFIIAIFLVIKRIIHLCKNKKKNSCEGCVGGNLCNSCPVKKE